MATPPDPMDGLPEELAGDGSDQPSQPQAPQTSAEAESAQPEDPAKKPMTETFKQLQQEQPRTVATWFVLGGIALAVVVVLIVVITLQREGVQQKKPQVATNFGESEDVNTELTALIETLSEQVPRLKADVREDSGRINALEAKMDSMDETNQRRFEQLEELMKTQMAAIERLGQQPQGRRSDEGDSSMPKSTWDVTALESTLKKEMATAGLSLEEARIRIDTFLKQAGFEGEELMVVRNGMLDRLGYLYVGDVAEDPLTDEDLAALPEGLVLHVKALADYLYQRGQFEGHVVYRPEIALTWLKEHVPEEIQAQVGPEVLIEAGKLARVRKENVTKEQESLLGEFARMRDHQAINPGNVYRIERLVYDNKGMFSVMTPGQHLSLTMALAGLRAKPGTTTSSTSQRPKAEDLAVLAGYAERALTVALEQGIREQGELIRRGRAAVTSKAQDLKLVIGDDERDRIVYGVIGKILRAERVAGAEATADATGAGQAPQGTGGHAAPSKSEPKALARMGPVELGREDLQRYIWLLSDVVAETFKFEPGTRQHAAILAGLWTRTPILAGGMNQALGEEQPLPEVAREVYSVLQQVAEGSLVMGNTPSVVDEDQWPVQAIYFGSLYGKTLEQEGLTPERIEEELVAAKSDQPPPWVGVARNQRTPITDAADVYDLMQQMGLAAPILNEHRARMLLELRKSQMIEREIAFRQAATIAAEVGLGDQVVTNLTDAVRYIVPAILAGIEDSLVNEELIERRVVYEANRFAASYLAEAALLKLVTDEVIQPHSGQLDSDAVLQRSYEDIRRYIPSRIREVLSQANPKLGDDDIAPVAKEVTMSLHDEVVHFAAQRMVVRNIEPRLYTAAGSLKRSQVPQALEAVEEAVAKIVVLPLTVNGIDEAMRTAHEIGIQALNGAGKTTVTVRQGNGSGPGLAAQPLRVLADSGLPGLAVGQIERIGPGQKVFSIPKGATLVCVAESGTELAIKGTSNNQDVQLRGRGGYFTPSGKWYPLPPFVVQGTMTANLGGNRIDVEATGLVFEMPNGLIVSKEISGYVVDVLDGKAGMLAQFDRNWDKIMPEAGMYGTLSGIAAGLANQNQQVDVTVGSTVVTEEPVDDFQRGVGEGVAEGVELLKEYSKSYMDQISPTLNTPNGQPVTVLLRATVELPELTLEDMQLLSDGDMSNAGF